MNWVIVYLQITKNMVVEKTSPLLTQSAAKR